ncbi:sulfite exporter TauE/SafE family protein [Halegenticoccus tardaugens]|uniref:sulfite exporter TauE/SafE family protein n=1 Tax=Halegenticoccus tardaugens TaxID=2071624 RepID=UPI00100B15D4|nr:sulfite exporter TauE/SafE family protein [Halegenticoccus tardaugens]
MPPEPSILVALVCIALVAGVGITTVGPGGVFVTAALFALTPASPATVAGTASATFVATGLLGSYTYRRSGELSGDRGRALATVLSVTGVLGAVVGATLNTRLPRAVFGGLLAAFLAGVGLVLVIRERRGLAAVVEVDAGTTRGRTVVGAVGFVIGVAGGLLGVGGPVLTVPALVLLGTPMLLAVAAAQVQSVFLSGFATATYLTHGAVSPRLAVVVGVPQLVGVVLGWHVAHRVPAPRLRSALGGVLVLVGVVLVA